MLPWHSKFFSEVVFVSILGALLHIACLQPEDAVSSLCIHHELMIHLHSLCTVRSCTFSTMQWDDEMRLIRYRRSGNFHVIKFSRFKFLRKNIFVV